MSATEDLARLQRPGVPDALSAGEALTELLDLPAVGLRVTGGRIVGAGITASADIYLSNGEALTFESLRDLAKPGELMLTVAAGTGASPQLKAADARQAVVLLRALAERQATATADDVATDWGLTFLQETRVLDVTMSERGARFAAFEHLREHAAADVREALATRVGSVAAATVTLRDTDGTRYVRAGWFYAHARQGGAHLTDGAVAARMRRVGWEQRGTEGRIKATSEVSGSLVWTFLVVPAGWEDSQ